MGNRTASRRPASLSVAGSARAAGDANSHQNFTLTLVKK